MAVPILYLIGGVTGIGMVIFAGVREAMTRRRKRDEETLSMEPYFTGEASVDASTTSKAPEMATHS